ncbi:MAG TPA: hypothetical protein VMU14_13155 [Acidimicrobiales bacterium]|nr:hypothetical protein [Acidimicrobiales bacterium]
MLHHGAHGDADGLRRFRRVAAVGSLLRHPNIVAVLLYELDEADRVCPPCQGQLEPARLT